MNTLLPRGGGGTLRYCLRRNPHEGKYFGVKASRDGRADPGELARAADRLVMIRSRLEEARTPLPVA